MSGEKRNGSRKFNSSSSASSQKLGSYPQESNLSLSHPTYSPLPSSVELPLNISCMQHPFSISIISAVGSPMVLSHCCPSPPLIKLPVLMASHAYWMRLWCSSRRAFSAWTFRSFSFEQGVSVQSVKQHTKTLTWPLTIFTAIFSCHILMSPFLQNTICFSHSWMSLTWTPVGLGFLSFCLSISLTPLRLSYAKNLLWAHSSWTGGGRSCWGSSCRVFNGALIFFLLVVKHSTTQCTVAICASFSFISNTEYNA